MCVFLWLRQSTEYDTYLKPVGYTKYSRSNAYTGNGAEDIDTDASAPTGLTPAQCTQRCAYEATTSSTYTRARTHTHTHTHTDSHTLTHTHIGRCAPFLSARVQRHRCDDDARCSCVTFSPSDGTCWKRAACVPPEFATGTDAAGYVVWVNRGRIAPPAPVPVVLAARV